jgi:hypothetical protein
MRVSLAPLKNTSSIWYVIFNSLKTLSPHIGGGGIIIIIVAMGCGGGAAACACAAQCEGQAAGAPSAARLGGDEVNADALDAAPESSRSNTDDLMAFSIRQLLGGQGRGYISMRQNPGQKY